MQSAYIETLRRKDPQKGPEDRFQVVFGIDMGHSDDRLPKDDIQEFLYNLITDNSDPCFDGCANQIGSSRCLDGSALIKRISKYVRIQKKPIAHSSRLE